jgi:hypothetical protein
MINDQRVSRDHYQGVLTKIAQKEAFHRLADWLKIPFHGCSGKMESIPFQWDHTNVHAFLEGQEMAQMLCSSGADRLIATGYTSEQAQQIFHCSLRKGLFETCGIFGAACLIAGVDTLVAIIHEEAQKQVSSGQTLRLCHPKHHTDITARIALHLPTVNDVTWVQVYTRAIERAGERIQQQRPFLRQEAEGVAIEQSRERPDSAREDLLLACSVAGVPDNAIDHLPTSIDYIASLFTYPGTLPFFNKVTSIVRVESLDRCRLNAALTRMLFPFSSRNDLAHIKHVRETTFREYCSKGYTLIKDEMHNGEKDCEILQVLDFLQQIGTKRIIRCDT